MPVKVDNTMTTTEEKKVRGENRWLTHVKKYRESNPGTKYKDALKAAAASYTKTVVAEKEPGEVRVNPWMEHIADWKVANSDWKAKMQYRDVLKLCQKTYKKKTQGEPIQS